MLAKREEDSEEESPPPPAKARSSSSSSSNLSSSSKHSSSSSSKHSSSSLSSKLRTSSPPLVKPSKLSPKVVPGKPVVERSTLPETSRSEKIRAELERTSRIEQELVRARKGLPPPPLEGSRGREPEVRRSWEQEAGGESKSVFSRLGAAEGEKEKVVVKKEQVLKKEQVEKEVRGGSIFERLGRQEGGRTEEQEARVSSTSEEGRSSASSWEEGQGLARAARASASPGRGMRLN